MGAHAEQDAYVLLQRAAAALHEEMVELLKPHGLSPTQYNVLRILRGGGEEGLPTLDVASRMIEHSPGVTRLLDRLERRRLARRVRCPEDRRQVLCHATEPARRLLAGLAGPMADASRAFVASLDAARTAELVRSLDAVRATASTHVAPVPSPTRNNDRKRK